MRKLIFIFTVLSAAVINAQEKEKFMDSRDGKVYQTIKIGNQWIMSENFAYKPESGNYWASGNNPANIKELGYLYDWETALKIAPKGWHLPNKEEWDKLIKFLGDDYLKVFEAVKQGGSSGFNALYAGSILGSENFENSGVNGNYWSSTSYDNTISYYFRCNANAGKAGLDGSKKINGYSVRLFKDTINSETRIINNEQSTKIANTFEAYKANFKRSQLPLAFSQKSVNTSELPHFSSTNFKNIREERALTEWWAYKSIPANGKFIAVLSLEYNRINNLVPVLETYSVSGKLIDSKVLDFGWEEYVDYKDSIIIYKNFNIYISGIVEEVDLDENEQEIPGSRRKKLHYINGKFLPNGKIELSKPLNKIL